MHAKKAGGSGAAGELVLAARYLDVDGRHLELRSLRLVPEGNSKINTVNTMMVATAASPIPVSLVGFFINGGQAVVPQGTIAGGEDGGDFRFSERQGYGAGFNDAGRSRPNREKNNETP